MSVKKDVLYLIQNTIDSLDYNFPFTHDDEVKKDVLMTLYDDINECIIALPVIKNEKHGSYRCAYCNAVVHISQHYCSQCGQQLDWRKVK